MRVHKTVKKKRATEVKRISGDSTIMLRTLLILRGPGVALGEVREHGPHGMEREAKALVAVAAAVLATVCLAAAHGRRVRTEHGRRREHGHTANTRAWTRATSDKRADSG